MALLKAAVKDPLKEEKAGRLTGKQYFLQGDGVEAEALGEEDEDFDDEDLEDSDDDDMLNEYLAGKA
jgi:hypothetical protein